MKPPAPVTATRVGCMESPLAMRSGCIMLNTIAQAWTLLSREGAMATAIRKNAVLPLAALLFATPAAATVIDPSLVETRLLTGFSPQVTGMAWAPDGSNRLFVIDKTGLVILVQMGVDANGAFNATRLPTPFTTVLREDGGPLYQQVECGLVGIVFDPSFATNGFVYFRATVSQTEQQILRFRDAGGVGVDRTVILAGLPARDSHLSGGMAFDHDGKLRFAIGDLGFGTRVGTFRPSGDVQAELSTLASKSSRINRDGTVPKDNPFFDGPGPNADAIYARGFRNPFRMAVQPSTGLVWQLVTGAKWEQVFILRPGVNAGWDTLENDEDGQPGLITPVIAYLTNAGTPGHVRPITAASRAAGIATFTTGAAHQFRRGARLTIAGVSDASFNGTAYLKSVVSTTQFTVASEGGDASATGGAAVALTIGGAITDAAFVQGTLFPEDWRGHFVFVDLNSGNVVRAILDETNEPTRVDLAANVQAGAVGVNIGPDGALYVLNIFLGNLDRYSPPPALVPRLVVDRTPLRVEDGSSAVLSVRLARAPVGNVTVGTSISGAPEATVTAGSTLTFTPANWQIPQPIAVAAARDPDTDDSKATLTLSAEGLPTVTVPVLVRDIDVQALTVSASSLDLVEGGAVGSFDVRLARAPAADTTVTVARTSGSDRISIASGVTLTFTPANFGTPQRVTVVAIAGGDPQPSTAVLTVSSADAQSRTVNVEASAPLPTEPRLRPLSPISGGSGGCSSGPAASLWAVLALLALRSRRGHVRGS